MVWHSKQFFAMVVVNSLLFGFSLLNQDNASRKALKAQGSKAAEQEPGLDHGILWQEPTDIESRNLFYGIGGEDGAPDPADEFTFLHRKGSAFDPSEKFEVIDAQGQKWTVKLGAEARSEVTATRIVWAAGYYVDQGYLIPKARIKGRGNFTVSNARFERDDDGYQTVSRWDWKNNPFASTRELQGLKVLMALLNNWDISTANNKVIKRKDKDNEAEKVIFYVNDLGASLGNTGTVFNRIPIWADAAGSDARADAEAFASHPFIDGISNNRVIFHWRRKFGKDILEGITVENARWMGNLLARLSDDQLQDAFRAGGFSAAEIAIYVSAIRKRIKQLQELS